MPAPTVSSVTPLAGATDVYRNAALSLVFSEALLEASVNTGTFLLRELSTRRLVPVAVDLSDDGLTVTLRSIGYLAPQTLHEIVALGADAVLAADAVQSADTTPLATTYRSSFQTGDEVEATATTKTEAEEALEGDLGLPSDVYVQASASTLLITATSPAHEQFDVDPDLTSIRVTFANDVDAATINATTFSVRIVPYYPEDELFLARPSDDGLCNFQFEEHTDANGDPYDYADPTGTLSVTGNTVTWTLDEGQSFCRNAKVQVVLNSAIADVDGLTLGSDYLLSFYIRMCPNVVSVESVRDAFFPLVLSPADGWTDGIIGKGLYRNVLDMLAKVRFQVHHGKIQPNLRRYALCRTVDDLFRALRAESDLLAGQFKRIGDWAERIDVNAASALPAAHRQAIDCWKAAEIELRRRFVDAPILVVRGVHHAEQRWAWRTRTWHNDIAESLQGANYVGPVGNSAAHRATKVAGFYEQWG